MTKKQAQYVQQLEDRVKELEEYIASIQAPKSSFITVYGLEHPLNPMTHTNNINIA